MVSTASCRGRSWHQSAHTARPSLSAFNIARQTSGLTQPILSSYSSYRQNDKHRIGIAIVKDSTCRYLSFSVILGLDFTSRNRFFLISFPEVTTKPVTLDKEKSSTNIPPQRQSLNTTLTSKDNWSRKRQVITTKDTNRPFHG